MAIAIKRGTGAWVNVPNGTLKIRSGGAWVSPNYVYIRSGGIWRDSGYRGYPNTPASMWVNDWTSWGFSQVQVAWNYATGGAPATTYDVEMLNSGDGVIAQNYGVTVNYTNFAVAEDYVVKFRVRSSSAAGLKSGWTDHNLAAVRARIGHTEQGTWYNDWYTRDWVGPGPVAVNLYNRAYGVVNVPSYVDVWGMYVDLHGTYPWAYNSPGSGSQRDIYIVTNGNLRYDLGVQTWANPTQGWAAGCTGNGGNQDWGLFADGAGFSQYSDGAYRVTGTIHVRGTETYSVYNYHMTRAYLANAYW